MLISLLEKSLNYNKYRGGGAISLYNFFICLPPKLTSVSEAVVVFLLFPVRRVPHKRVNIFSTLPSARNLLFTRL